jgi:ParB family chromosome partitioning protein
MPKQRFGLGRGIDALIPGAQPVPEDRPLDTSLSASSLYDVPVDAIAPNPHQPRGPLEDDEQLMELADSIHQYGLLQPLLVTRADEDDDGPPYHLIAGERRWRAARRAGLELVPVVITDATPQLMLEMALVENLQRTDLNPLEEAQGYQTLIKEYRLRQEDVAQRVGRKRETISNKIRLLQLPEQVRGALITMPEIFTEGHARAVLGITGDDQRVLATQQIISDRMSVREAEELARRHNGDSLLLTPDRRGGKSRPQSYETHMLQEEFTRAVQMKVRLQRSTKGKGSLTLYFTNEEQLQLLYQYLVEQQRQAAGLLGMNALDFSELVRLNGADTANGASGSSDATSDQDAPDEAFDVAFDDE